MKSKILFFICLSCIVIFLNLVTIMSNSDMLTARILERAESQLRSKDYSLALELYSYGYRIKPLVEFKEGIGGAQKFILEDSIKSHGQGNLIQAEHEYRKVNNLNKEQKIAYLTFDDGPSKNTLKILDILESYKVKATFFVTGNSSKFGIEVYQKIASKGHVLGNHTYSHNYNKIYVSTEGFLKDFYELENLLSKSVGIRPKIFRFPGGSNNLVSKTIGGKKIMNNLKDILGSKGYQYFDWNVNSKDADVILQDTQIIIDSVLESSRNKEEIIVLMHDTIAKKTTPEALPIIIEGLRKQGFAFDTLP